MTSEPKDFSDEVLIVALKLVHAELAELDRRHAEGRAVYRKCAAEAMKRGIPRGAWLLPDPAPSEDRRRDDEL